MAKYVHFVLNSLCAIELYCVVYEEYLLVLLYLFILSKKFLISYDLMKNVCLILFVLFLFFLDRASLYSPGTHSVDQAGLELRNPSASASQVLGLKAYTTMPSCLVLLCILSSVHFLSRFFVCSFGFFLLLLFGFMRQRFSAVLAILELTP